jgi:predicted alpha/beta superfamily hydrolase
MHSRHPGGTVGSARSLLAAAIMAMVAASVSAQPTPRLTVVSEGDAPAADSRRFVVHSALVGRDFVVVVSRPPIFASWVSTDLKAAGSTQPDRKLPAIYALDAGYSIAGPMAQMMAGVGTMSPAYVVSVGYGEGQPDGHNTDLLHRPVTEGGVTYGGGGARFQAFLIEELRPFLEARYPLDPRHASLFGHSFGGLFAANVLAESPDAFDGYVIASPSVWIDPQVLGRLAAARGNQHRVFIAVGDQEEARMVDGANQLAAVLSAAPSRFTVEKKVFAGEGHISYYPLLVQAAFTWLAPPPGIERKAMVLSRDALQRVAGVYELGDGRVVTVTLEAAKAFVQVTGLPGQSELLAESAQRFFLPGGYNVSMTFEGAMDAPASAVIINMNGTELRGRRRAP